MDIYFADSETISLEDVTRVGPYKYGHHFSTDILVWGFAPGAAQGSVWSPAWCWGNSDKSKPDPSAPTALIEHVKAGGLIVFWNAAFDRWIWNAVMVPKYGWPYLPLEQVLCAQAQAEANNLPGGLNKACEALGTRYKKDPRGKSLIKTLSTGSRETWDSVRYENSKFMGHFRSYCLRDVYAMRDVWQRTRPLSWTEWQEYHVSEHINDRGVAVDKEFAQVAQKYATAEAQEINRQLFELTGDRHMTVSAHLRKAAWLHENLYGDEELQAIVRRPARGEEKKRPRYSCDRATRDAILEMIPQPEHAKRYTPEQADRVVRFLELIEAGNSAAIKKFTAIAQREYRGRVFGSYSFNGAGATGRYSSRGIQVHNMINAPVDYADRDRAMDAIEMILDGATPQRLRDEFEYPISRLLARLIRPTFIAPPGKLLVWADWDQIEARILPWLANTRSAYKKLRLYEDGIDVYRHTASKILDQAFESIGPRTRAAFGKVPELSLQYGGGVGALTAMARNYGVTLGERQKHDIVAAWRQANGWAGSLWDLLWQAAIKAFNHPGDIFEAGRMRYMFEAQLMEGSLIAILPDDRLLVYPQFKHERVEVKSKRGRVRKRWRTSYLKGFSNGSARVDCWHGTLAENATQAVAASFLRLALSRLDKYDNVVLHTHDEIVSESGVRDVRTTKERMEYAMTELPEWAEGLPLSVSFDSGPYYTK